MGQDQKRLDRRDIFRFKQFEIHQECCAMKVGTDGLLLGAMTDVTSGKNALDIGTGTGVISLMLAQRSSDLQISAIEIDEAAALQASENFKRSPFEDRLQVIATSLQDYLPASQFDLIVSNPPFFSEGVISPDLGRHQARHAQHLPMDQLMKFVNQHLRPKGRMWLIVPDKTANSTIEEATNKKLYLRRQVKIRPYPQKGIERQVLCFSKEEGSLFTEEMLIKTAMNGPWSDAYIALTKEFHPHF